MQDEGLGQAGKRVGEVQDSHRHTVLTLPAPASQIEASRVVICLITFRRPVGLRRALHSLAEQTLADRHSLRVMLVENELEGRAAEIVEEFKSERRFDLRFGVENERGIPHARNCAHRLALEHWPDASGLAWIDDDETAEPDWLERLIECQHETGAHVTTGPSVPCFQEEPPDWIISGRYFDPPDLPTRTQRSTAYTNNVLTHVDVVREMSPMFEVRLSGNGSDDSLAFMRVANQGYRIVWCREAQTNEHVPTSRMSPDWVCQRSFRYGNASVYIAMMLGKTRSGPLLQIAIAIYRLAKAATLRCGPGLWSQAARISAARHVAYARGVFSALRGSLYREYGTIHGS